MPLPGLRSRYIWVRAAEKESHDTEERGRADRRDRTRLMPAKSAVRERI